MLAASTVELTDDVGAMIKEGKFIEADRQVDSALTVTPDDYHLLILKGDIFIAQKNYSEALKYYEQALVQKDNSPEALYGAGIAALNTGSAQKALDYFAAGEKTNKRKADFLYGKALAQKDLGQLADADKTIRTALNKDKENPTLHRALGDINYAKEVWSIALSEYATVLSLDSTQTDLYYKIARSNLYSRNITDAVKWYKDYLKIYNTDVTAWKELSDICRAANLSNESIFCYNNLTTLDPNNGEYWFTLGDIQYNANNYEEAGVALEKSVSLGYNVAESYKRLAKVYYLRKEYYKADSAYTRFENELGAPDDPEYWADKGKTMIKIGQSDPAFFDRAIASFDKTITLDSTNAGYWEYAGLARYYKQDFRGAIPYFIKRIALGEENVNAIRNLAFCYLKIEQYDQAASSLEKAIALKPDDAVMRKMIGKIYIFLSGRNPENMETIIQKAIPHLKIALQDTTKTLTAAEICEAKGDLGFCYLTIRDAKNAISYLEAAVRCNSRDVDYLFNLASAYHLDNQIDLANEYYSKVLEINPDHKGAKEGKLRTTRLEKK